MFKNIFIAIFCLILTQSFGQESLLEVAGEKISKEEFLAIYQKNNFKDSNLTKESLDEYLELYINFRLKVKEAESLGLHNQDKFKDEFTGYKKQLSQSYLVDKNVTEDLIKEVYNRLKEEVKASHILISLKPNSLPEDTLKVYNQLMELRKRVEKGEDFGKLAKEFSNDPSAQKNNGDLGFFTALKMVYTFESAAYNTPIGSVSKPIRTKFGYHIIKVDDRRPSTGELKVAHIMVKLGKAGNKEQNVKAEKLIKEISAKIKKGEDFSDLAKTYSDDPSSKRKGGDLPWFRTNTYPSEFEEIAYSLKENGEISEPFMTPYGWHIVKRIDHKPMESFEEMEESLRAKVARDSRAKLSKEIVLKRIQNEYSFKEYKDNLKPVMDIMDSTYFDGSWDMNSGSKLKKKLFVLDKVKYTQQDFLKYLNEFNGRRKKGDVREITYSFYDKWVKETCFEYEESKLSSKYPDYQRLLEEYRNGILLFDLTDEMVWSKAINDTVGLENFYNDNKSDFMWNSRLDAEIYTCENDSIANALRTMLLDSATVPQILEALNVQSDLKVRVDRGQYEKEDKEILEKIMWDKGISKNVALNNKVYVVNVKKVLKPMPKEINEARGVIIAAYQNYLDQTWIKELRAKYTFKVNDEIYQTLLP